MNPLNLFNSMKIRTKLITSFLVCSLVPLAVASILIYQTASTGLLKVDHQGAEALDHAAFNELTALRDVKANQIEQYFAERRGDLDVLVDNVASLRNEAFNKLTAVQDIKTSAIDRLLDVMRRDVEMLAQSEAAREAFKDFQAYHDTSGADARGELNVSSEAYRGIYDKWYPKMEKYVNRAGYYDVFLMCAAHGHVLFTEAKESDLGANLGDGPLKDEGLGRAWKQAVETGETAMVDFSAYSPSNGDQAAFMASPVRDDAGQIIAVVALQMPTAPINDIVQSRKGLGRSGETFLVGHNDGTTSFRSDLQTMGEGKYVVGREFHTEYVDRAIREQRSFEKVYTDTSGKLVMIAADPINVEGLHWACITKMDLEEAIAPRVPGKSDDFFTLYAKQYGYDDLFLIDPNGECFYSVGRKADYGTNLVDGRFKDSNLGELTREVLASKQFGFADFAPYAPADGHPEAFIAQPEMHKGEVEVIIALEIPLTQINKVMKQRSGMGETGETYLVGPDKLMRSDSYLAPETHSVAASFANPNQGRVDTKAATAALGGQKDAEIIEDYNGHPVLSAYAPLQVFDQTWALLAEMDEAEAFAAVEQMDQTSADASTALIQWSVGVAVVSVVGVALLAFLMASLIVGPIRAMVDRLKDIAQGEGDLTQRVDENRQDELGELGKWFNTFVKKIHDVVREVAGSANEVAGAATEIANSSEEMASGVREQTEQVGQISSAVEEMSSSIEEVARKSSDAANSADSSGKVAEEGGQVVRQTVDGMEAINEAVSSSAAKVQELGKRGDQIGQIIEVINDIADQTNLLALNAAIEAARAGEHGRGFAVVADEVRKLADRTTKATEEIAESIQAIQTETGAAVERMNSGTDEVKKGVELATGAGESLNKIVNSAKEVAEMIQAIAAAAEEQSSASEQVSRNIESIKSVSQQSAEGANQSASAASQLSSKAEQLQTLVGQFKLEQSANS